MREMKAAASLNISRSKSGGRAGSLAIQFEVDAVKRMHLPVGIDAR
jgi:hypothetical protein